MKARADVAIGPTSNAYGLSWPHPLFPYQRAGVDKLTSDSSVLLADEMGLGKTIQAIAALRVLASRGEARRALIICPAGLILQWRRQIRLWAPELTISTVVGSAGQRSAAWKREANLYLTSYEAVRADLGNPRRRRGGTTACGTRW